MATEIPKYDNVKTRLCQERREILGTEQNPEFYFYFRNNRNVSQITPALLEAITMVTRETELFSSLGKIVNINL
jgi:hypothetical protein